MKRWLKRGLKAVWRATLPLRRPIQKRIDAYFRRCFAPVLAVSDEMDLALNHVVRELIRLQEQVEQLQQTLDELTEARERLSVVSEREAG